MLLWELCFEKKPYRDLNIDQIMEHVQEGGREHFRFVPGKEPGDTEIQREFAEIIKQSQCVLVWDKFFQFFQHLINTCWRY